MTLAAKFMLLSRVSERSATHTKKEKTTILRVHRASIGSSGFDTFSYKAQLHLQK